MIIFYAQAETKIAIYIQKFITNIAFLHEGKRPMRRPRRRWEDNIKMGQKIGL